MLPIPGYPSKSVALSSSSRTLIQKDAGLTAGVSGAAHFPSMVDEVHMERNPEVGRNDFLQRIVSLFSFHPTLKKTEPGEDTHTVGIDRKDFTVKRVHHHTTSSLGSHSGKPPEERLDLLVWQISQWIQGYGPEGLPYPPHLSLEPRDLESSHSTFFNGGNKTICPYREQPTPVTQYHFLERVETTMECRLSRTN